MHVIAYAHTCRHAHTHTHTHTDFTAHCDKVYAIFSYSSALVSEATGYQLVYIAANLAPDEISTTLVKKLHK